MLYMIPKSLVIICHKARPVDRRGDPDLISKRLIDSLECRELVIDAIKREHQNRGADGNRGV